MYFFHFGFILSIFFGGGYSFPEPQVYWRLKNVVDVINMNYHTDIVWINLTAENNNWSYAKGVTGAMNVIEDLDDHYDVM